MIDNNDNFTLNPKTNIKTLQEDVNKLKNQNDEHKSITKTIREELDRHKTFRKEVEKTLNRNIMISTVIITLISIFFTLATTLITFIVETKIKISIEQIWATIGIIAAPILLLLILALIGFLIISKSWIKNSSNF